MTIFYNNIPTELPSSGMTLEELAKWKGIPEQGAAIAINDKLVKRENWSVTKLSPHDQVTVITAAYGG